MKKGESETARIAAAKELLDRGYGKPKQESDVGGGVTVIIRRCGEEGTPVVPVQPALEYHSADKAEPAEES